MNENKKEMIEVTETSENKKGEVISKVKNWFRTNAKTLAAGAAVAIAGMVGFALGKASTYTEFEEIDDYEVIDDENENSNEDSTVEE